MPLKLLFTISLLSLPMICRAEVLQISGSGFAVRHTVNSSATETGSSITFLYRLHGSHERGFEGIAPAVDGVIGQQLERLGQRLESR